MKPPCQQVGTKKNENNIKQLLIYFQTKKENGFSLIATIFIILLLSLLSIISTSMVSTYTQLYVDSIFSSQAFYLAESGRSYCIKKQLSKTQNWSNNENITKVFANGSFSIEYDPNRRKEKEATIIFTGTVRDITRKIICKFMKPEWFDKFSYSYYVGKNYNTDGVVDYNKEGKEYIAPDYVKFNINFNFYRERAKAYGQYYLKNLILDGKDPNIPEHITGVYFVENSEVIIRNFNNKTIKATIVAYNGRITLEYNIFLKIEPEDKMPALVSKGNSVQITDGSYLIKGGIFTKGNIIIKPRSDSVINYGIIYSENNIYIEVLSEDNTFENHGIILSWGQTKIEDISVFDTIKVYYDDDWVSKKVLGIDVINDLKLKMISWKEIY